MGYTAHPEEHKSARSPGRERLTLGELATLQARDAWGEQLTPAEREAVDEVEAVMAPIREHLAGITRAMAPVCEHVAEISRAMAPVTARVEQNMRILRQALPSQQALEQMQRRYAAWLVRGGVERRRGSDQLLRAHTRARRGGAERRPSSARRTRTSARSGSRGDPDLADSEPPRWSRPQAVAGVALSGMGRWSR